MFRIGNGLAFFVLSIGVLTGFYVANWEEYHTGVLQTNFKGFGVTESHLGLTLFLLIQAISNGYFASITMEEIGQLILPSIKEEMVYTRVKHLVGILGVKE